MNTGQQRKTLTPSRPATAIRSLPARRAKPHASLQKSDDLSKSADHRAIPRSSGHPAVYNRLRVLMVHTSRYAFGGQARLASDVGVARSTISRLINGQSSPSFTLVQAVTTALEKQLGRSLDPREIVSPDSTYPTASGCALAGCRGCMPEEAYDSDGNLRPEYRDLQPGDWSLSRPLHPQPMTNSQPLTTSQQPSTGKENS